MNAQHTTTIEQLIAKWDSPDGHPYKGKLIDWDAYEADPTNIGCMCVQGQALHLLGGMSPEKIRTMEQSSADAETAKLLGISRTHAVLLRNTNDSVDGALTIVLTHPEKVLGDQAPTILAFWRHLDRMTAKQWAACAVAAMYATGALAAAEYAAWAAAESADMAAAWAASWAWYEAGNWGITGALAAAGVAAGSATYEIQGAAIMRKNGTPFFFLPLFGFADPEAVLAADEVA